ncbi:DNA sulfur modification protein DndB, partial [Halomonas sp. 141]|uniref:DNA sulfur modification protein DndB n=1 Tax=Halomonas sp. 141 TaxID=2056666 RepID=UPI0018E21CB8
TAMKEWQAKRPELFTKRVVNHTGPDRYVSSEDNGLNIDGVSISHPGAEDKKKLFNNVPVELRWDKDKISAVVVDGQHRVEALRRFYHGEGSEGESSISVSFVIFENADDLPVVDATRQLFIDVNNTPKRVSEQKLIFIDDRNLLRRVSSRALGALPPGGNSEEDPYQKLHKKGCFSFASLDYINKYLVGEDGSDDEDINTIFRSHESLFPWEVTHILTLHDNLIQSILLSDSGVVDGNASLVKVCRIINDNILENLLDDALSGWPEDLEELPDFLRNNGLEEGEQEAFIRLTELRLSYLEALNEINESGELKRERDEKVRGLKLQYATKYESIRAFDFSVKSTTSLVGSSLSAVCEIASRVFNSLWFVTEIHDCLENGVEGFGPEEAYKFIVMSKEKFSSWSRNGTVKLKKAREEYVSINDFSEAKSLALKSFIQRLEAQTNGNLLRTMVGQQMLFGYLDAQDRLRDGDLSYLNEHLGEIIQPINNLGLAGYFDIKKTIEFNVCGVLLGLSPWEGLIVKNEAMSPGPNNAAKGSKLLNLISLEVKVRSDVSRKRVGMSDYNSVIMSYGSRVFEKLSVEMTMEKIWQALIHNNCLNYLTENEANNFSSPDFPDAESASYPRLVKKVLGGMYYEKVYDEMLPLMKS